MPLNIIRIFYFELRIAVLERAGQKAHGTLVNSFAVKKLRQKRSVRTK